MHLVVIKRSTVEKYPFVPQSLFSAFVESKNIALTRMKNLAALRYMLPWLTDDLDELDMIFDGDPWPYGLEHNKICIDTLVSHMVEQGIIAKSLDWNSLFMQVQ